jgi:hypothetical protein
LVELVECTRVFLFIFLNFGGRNRELGAVVVVLVGRNHPVENIVRDGDTPDYAGNLSGDSRPVNRKAIRVQDGLSR